MIERLTKRTENGGVQFSNGEYWNTVYQQNEHCLTDIHRMAIKLCELEDKIEQGKIVELPCSVGGRKRLYYPVKGTNTILETKVFGIGVDEDGDFIFNPTEYHEKVIEMRGVEIGKTVFLDRSSAEAKLLEMEGERE
jgi:hypothetical protein